MRINSVDFPSYPAFPRIFFKNCPIFNSVISPLLYYPQIILNYYSLKCKMDHSNNCSHLVLQTNSITLYQFTFPGCWAPEFLFLFLARVGQTVTIAAFCSGGISGSMANCPLGWCSTSSLFWHMFLLINLHSPCYWKVKYFLQLWQSGCFMFSTVCLKFVLSPWLGLFPISFDTDSKSHTVSISWVVNCLNFLVPISNAGAI